MTGLIITCVLCWLGGFFINGFTLYQILLIVPTIMFSVRKVGIHIKMSNILVPEIMFLFFSIVWRLLFKKFILWKFLVSMVLRIIFICIIVYDDTVYVYKQEERKKI